MDDLFWQAFVLCSLRWPEGRERGVMCVEIIKFGSIISLLNCLHISLDCSLEIFHYQLAC